jgi:Acyltransferase family
MKPSAFRAQKQLRPLTSIRFLFALLVVVFHGQETLEQGGFENWPFFAQAVISHGYVGVSFFFVLSGFILAYTYRRKLTKAEFWGARFARIYPAYLLAFIIILPIAIYAATLNGDRGLAVFTTGLQLTLTQSWVPYTALQWNAPAWSLSVEAFFYALFPLLFLRAQSLSAGKLLGTAALAYMASQIGALIGWRYGPSLSDAINGGMGLQGPNDDVRKLFFICAQCACQFGFASIDDPCGLSRVRFWFRNYRTAYTRRDDQQWPVDAVPGACACGIGLFAISTVQSSGICATRRCELFALPSTCPTLELDESCRRPFLPLAGAVTEAVFLRLCRVDHCGILNVTASGRNAVPACDPWLAATTFWGFSVAFA